MRIPVPPCLAVCLVLAVLPAPGQRHAGTWIYRGAADTTVVRCPTDPLTYLALPPRAVGTALPGRMYMKIELLPVDSLTLPRDSTCIGWCRVNAGSDSVRADILRGDGLSGARAMMQFERPMSWQLRWDSLGADVSRRRWHPTGLRGWTGASWVTIPGVTVAGNTFRFRRAHSFAAIAFVGAPPVLPASADRRIRPLAYALHQSYPDPAIPSATIGFTIPKPGFVSLEVFNMLGDRMVLVVSENLPAGVYMKSFNAENLARGAYFYRLTSGQFVDTKTFVLAR